MTKTEIEKLIAYIDNNAEKKEVYMGGIIETFVFSVNDLYDLLRNYPIECDKTAGPDYKAMYEHCTAELEKANACIDSMRFDMHHMAVERAHYTGAVAIIETICGRKFEPNK